MTEQPMLWVPAVEAVTFRASADPWGYWEARVAWRRSGARWLQEQSSDFDALTTSELLDAIAAELETRLLGPRLTP
jgi:hypothetical protein